MQTYKNNINQKALQGFHSAIHQTAIEVGKTMGAAGTNVAIEIEQYPYHLITNDGATIVESMWFEDPIEKMGHQFLKEVVGRSNKNSGDGSSTTTILVDAILKEGIELNTLEVKKSLDACIPIIEKSINDQKIMIKATDFERVKQVATVSGEDEKMGAMIAEIYGKIGENGIIKPEYVLGKEIDTYEETQGVRFEYKTGLLSDSMVHDEQAIKENRKENRAVYQNPLILVTAKKITNFKEIDPMVKLAYSKQKDLVIFTDDMDSQVATLLIQAHKTRKENPTIPLPRISVIKAPAIYKDFIFEDFSKCVGANIVCDATGITFKTLKETDLGTCEEIIIDKDETAIFGTADLTEHIAKLQNYIDSRNDDHDDAARRIAWLATKSVKLRIGGLSETEITYRRLKLDDAINATRSAITDGVVAGGGVIYKNVTKELPDTIGGKILKEALLAPIKQIMSNANNEYPGFTGFETMENNFGFDAKNGKIVDMLEAGIIDSAKVALNAMKNAIGISSTILTAPSALTLPPKKPEDALKEMMSRQGMMPMM